MLTCESESNARAWVTYQTDEYDPAPQRLIRQCHVITICAELTTTQHQPSLKNPSHNTPVMLVTAQSYTQCKYANEISPLITKLDFYADHCES